MTLRRFAPPQVGARMRRLPRRGITRTTVAAYVSANALLPSTSLFPSTSLTPQG